MDVLLAESHCSLMDWYSGKQINEAAVKQAPLYPSLFLTVPLIYQRCRKLTVSNITTALLCCRIVFLLTCGSMFILESHYSLFHIYLTFIAWLHWAPWFFSDRKWNLEKVELYLTSPSVSMVIDSYPCMVTEFPEFGGLGLNQNRSLRIFYSSVPLSALTCSCFSLVLGVQCLDLLSEMRAKPQKCL